MNQHIYQQGPDILFEIVKDEKYPLIAKAKAEEIYNEYENESEQDFTD